LFSFLHRRLERNLMRKAYQFEHKNSKTTLINDLFSFLPCSLMIVKCAQVGFSTLVVLSRV